MSDATVNAMPLAADSGTFVPGTPKPKRILLVEGDGFTRLVLLLRLRLAGFRVDFTSNGSLGLGKLRTCQPDILLVELKLCGLSGLDLIKAARAEPAFGNRPIYVFTHADRINRTARKEVMALATKVFDKRTMTREELVQSFATTFFKKEPSREKSAVDEPTKPPAEPVNAAVLYAEIEEIVAGVCDQCELLSRDPNGQDANGEELFSRVCSLGSCAEAAGLPNLSRQAKALEKYLNHLCKRKAYTDVALEMVSRAVEVMNRMSFKSAGKEKSLSRFSAVLVDEAPASIRATEKALREAGFDPACFDEAGRALEYLAANRTQLIIANLALPEAHGLALADLRKLPLQVKTPVLFGPEPGAARHLGEELPTSAPRLDSDPLLLAELVLKALNELQTTEESKPILARATASAPRTLPPRPAQPGRFGGLASEDGFDLFTKAASTPELTEESIPAEPFVRAEPGAPGPDQEAEFLVRLPETSTDGIQIDERPLEATPPPVRQVEMREPAQPEPTVEDQSAAINWMAAAPNEAAQSLPVISMVPAPEQNQAAPLADSHVAAPNYDEVMNNQLEATPVEYAQNGQAPRGDLAARVCAAEMALYHAKAEVERKDKTIEALQQQLAEVTAHQGGSGQTPEENPELQNALARCAELEQEVSSLRQAFEGFDGLGQQPPTGAEADQRVQELEQRLNQNAADLEKQKEEQQRTEADLRQQLDAAKTAGQPLEAARQQAEARCTQLEQDMGGLLQANADLNNKLAQLAEAKKSQAQTAAEAGAPESELEDQVRQGVAALARATAELAKERGERQRSQQRAAELNSRLQALHDDLRRTLQAQREDLARISSLEEEQRQTIQSLEQRTADVEQYKAEQQLAEEQLQKAKEANAQLRKDLSFYEEVNKKFGGGRQELQTRLETSLNAARESEAKWQQETAERQRLAENLENAQRDLQNHARRRELLEQELQVAQQALTEAEAKLQKENAERQRLNEALRSVQGNAHDRCDHDLELSKLQSSLELEQVERKRQETQLARIRQKAVDAAHATRALRTNLRRQVREPIDNLVHSTRSLLELEMGEEQKQLAEAVLQDVLLLQTRLRAPELASGEPAEPSSTTNP